MKSAEAHPEFQSYPDNIEFLTRSEHQDAHGGNFQNPTDGYYDPFTQETTGYRDNTYTPCKIIELSNPVRIVSADVVLQVRDDIDPEKAEDFTQKPIPSTPEDKNTIRNGTGEGKVHTVPKPTGGKSTLKRIGQAVKKAGGKVGAFAARHPGWAVAALEIVPAVVNVAINQSSNESPQADKRKNLQDIYPSNPTVYGEDGNDSDSDIIDCKEEKRNYPDERSSPKEHTVPGHGQHYHTKDGVIWKEKEAYKRGGTSDDS